MLADRCRSCGASVWFVEHITTLRRGIIDQRPYADGNILLVRTKGGYTRYRVMAEGESHNAGTAYFKSHFAVCPKAGDWRRSKGASE